MRITFLGTSHGVPEPNRKCSSILLEVGSSRYIIDMGTQAVEQLITRGISPASVKSIFVTHMHTDHTDGLISFVGLCSWYYKNADPGIYLPGDLEAAKTAMDAWMRCNGISMRPLRFLPVKEGMLYDDGVITVTAFPTKHTASSYAFLVEAEGKRVLFSGDLCHKGPQEDFPVSVLEQPLDLAICECAHFGTDKYIPLFKDNSNLKRLCFTHYVDKFISSMLTLKNELPGVEILRAQDGTEINL